MKTKNEIEKRLLELAGERRQLLNDVEDKKKPFNKQDFDDRLDAIVEEERTLKRDLAELDAPAPSAGKGLCDCAELRSLAEKSLETRGGRVSLESSGTVNTVDEMFSEALPGVEYLEYCQLFRGTDSQSKIPVWEVLPEGHFVEEGGSLEESTGENATKILDPLQAMLSTTITMTALKYASGMKEGQAIKEAFEKVIKRMAAKYMLIGQGAEHGEPLGLWNVAGTEHTGAENILGLAGFAQSIAGLGFEYPAIILNPSEYTKIVGSAGSNNVAKVYAEQLITEKVLEGIPVIVSAYAPAEISAGDIAAVGLDLRNYAIAYAPTVDIVAKSVPRSSLVTVDGYAYFTSAPIIDKDIHQYKISE